MSNLVRYGAQENNRMATLFDGIFDEWFSDDLFVPNYSRLTSRWTDNEVVYEFNLPGVKKDEVKVTAEINRITVSAKNNKTYYKESFSIHDCVDKEKITAKLENGVLTITAPLVESAKIKEIKIE